MNVNMGLPNVSALSVIAPLVPKFATSASDRFVEKGTFPPETGNSLVRMPDGSNVLSVVPFGTGKVIDKDSVPAGRAPCIWYEMPTWQVPVDGSVFASEQNINESMVTPSGDVDDPEANGKEAASPYDERVRVGTEFADAENARAQIAATPPTIFNFFTYTPKVKVGLPQLIARKWASNVYPSRVLKKRNLKSHDKYDLRSHARSDAKHESLSSHSTVQPVAQ